MAGTTPKALRLHVLTFLRSWVQMHVTDSTNIAGSCREGLSSCASGLRSKTLGGTLWQTVLRDQNPDKNCLTLLLIESHVIAVQRIRSASLIQIS